MQFIPMDSDQSRNEEFVPQFFVFISLGDVADGVLKEKGVAGGFVDDAVEDVCDDFALGSRNVSSGWG